MYTTSTKKRFGVVLLPRSNIPPFFDHHRGFFIFSPIFLFSACYYHKSYSSRDLQYCLVCMYDESDSDKKGRAPPRVCFFVTYYYLLLSMQKGKPAGCSKVRHGRLYSFLCFFLYVVLGNHARACLHAMMPNLRGPRKAGMVHASKPSWTLQMWRGTDDTKKAKDRSLTTRKQNIQYAENQEKRKNQKAEPELFVWYNLKSPSGSMAKSIFQQHTAQ